MNLYEVTNGYMGESYFRVYVWTVTEERALEMAGAKFKEHSDKRGRNNQYPKEYWTRLQVEKLFSIFKYDRLDFLEQSRFRLAALKNTLIFKRGNHKNNPGYESLEFRDHRYKSETMGSRLRRRLFGAKVAP